MLSINDLAPEILGMVFRAGCEYQYKRYFQMAQVPEVQQYLQEVRRTLPQARPKNGQEVYMEHVMKLFAVPVSRVCSKWRRVANSDPKLWVIHICEPSRRNGHGDQEGRAGWEAIRQLMVSNPVCDIRVSFQERSTLPGDYKNLLQVLGSFASRIASLQVILSFSESSREVIALLECGALNFPRLENLGIHFLQDDPAEGRTTLPINKLQAPLVVRVCLTDVRLNWSSTRDIELYSRLTHAELHHYHISPAYGPICDVLTFCTSLKALKVSSSHSSPPSNELELEGNLQRVEVKALVQLILYCDIRLAIYILARCTLSCLKWLEVHLYGSDLPPSFQRLIEEKSALPSLTDFVFIHNQSRHLHLFQALTLPSLNRLTLHFAYSRMEEESDGLHCQFGAALSHVSTVSLKGNVRMIRTFLGFIDSSSTLNWEVMALELAVSHSIDDIPESAKQNIHTVLSNVPCIRFSGEAPEFGLFCDLLLRGHTTNWRSLQLDLRGNKASGFMSRVDPSFLQHVAVLKLVVLECDSQTFALLYAATPNLKSLTIPYINKKIWGIVQPSSSPSDVYTQLLPPLLEDIHVESHLVSGEKTGRQFCDDDFVGLLKTLKVCGQAGRRLKKISFEQPIPPKVRTSLEALVDEVVEPE